MKDDRGRLTRRRFPLHLVLMRSDDDERSWSYCDCDCCGYYDCFDHDHCLREGGREGEREGGREGAVEWRGGWGDTCTCTCRHTYMYMYVYMSMHAQLREWEGE